MSETIARFFIDNFGDKLSAELIAFVISMLPILELRGGLIAAKLLGLNFAKAFVICFIGNLLPIPFILLFIRKIFNWLKRFKKVNAMINKQGRFAKPGKSKSIGFWVCSFLLPYLFPERERGPELWFPTFLISE